MRRIVLDVVVIVAVFLFVGGPTSHASVIYVDDEGGADFATIQEAIDTVVDGDTVLVAPGIYTGEGNRDIDFKGKAITVRSEDGPRTCIIDCQSRGNYFQQNLHRGFHFHSGEDLRSVLDGFMITGGRPPGHDCGGAILCDRAGPRIVNCIIRGNRARKGGGIGILDAAVHLERVAVVSNVAYYGGGIYCRSESADTSRSTFVRCTIAGNYADIDPRFGGEGGGIQLASNADFSNCLIVENRAGYRGGGICSRMNAQSCNLHDSIIWGNERNPGAYGDGHQISAYSCYGSLHIGHSVIQDEIGGDHIYDPRKGVEGHWLSADPCFARPGQWDPNNRPDTWYDDFWVDGDYHLQSRAGRWDPNSASWVTDDVTSPCIDAGDPNSPVGHEPFPNGGVINMGAYGGTAEASMSLARGPTEGQWTEPIPLYEINTETAEEWSPFLSPDGLTFYFGRVRSPESQLGRIFQATRPSPSDIFTSITEVPGPLNDSDGHVLCQWISSDGLRMYYTFQINAIFSLKVSERASTSAPWPAGTDISELNRFGSRLAAPYLTADERIIFFSASDFGGTIADYETWMAIRPGRTDRFGEPVNVEPINTTFNEIHPFITADGLTLYFASDRNGCYQLFRSARNDLDSSFGSPVHLTLFDTPEGDSRFPFLAADGSAFYFQRETSQDRSTRDICVAYRID